MNMIQQSIDPEEDDEVNFQSFSHGLHIGGSWIQASGGRQINVVDPSTEAVIAAVPDATLPLLPWKQPPQQHPAGAAPRRASVRKSCVAVSN
jgi:hypothetical protein